MSRFILYRLRRRVGIPIYFQIARRLPVPFARGGRGGRKQRAWSAGMFAVGVGKDVNIEKDAMITAMTQIGGSSARVTA